MRIAILISGKGSNMQSIIKWAESISQVKIVVVMSNNREAEGLTWVENYNKTHQSNIQTKYICTAPYKTKLTNIAEEKYINYLKVYKVDLICLAGFMVLIKERFIKAFNKRIINIHPSLLPAYKGLDTHARVIADQRKESGCTIHYVNEEMDDGEIIRQKKVSVNPEDTPESLKKKILAEELLLYPKVIQDIVNGKIPIGQ